MPRSRPSWLCRLSQTVPPSLVTTTSPASVLATRQQGGSDPFLDVGRSYTRMQLIRSATPSTP